MYLKIFERSMKFNSDSNQPLICFKNFILLKLLIKLNNRAKLIIIELK